MKLLLAMLPIYALIFILPISFIFPVPIEASSRELGQGLEKASFNKAEELFNEANYNKALVQYRRYIEDFPKGNFADKAIFQMGEIYGLQRNYFMAIRYYQRLSKLKVGQGLNDDANYKTALSYYHLGHFRNALQKLESNYSTLNDKNRGWKTIFLMGMVLEELEYKQTAFKKYLRSIRLATEVKQRQKSKNKIIKMIRNDLSLEDLIHFEKNLGEQYPLGFILFRISEIYESKREYALFQNYLTRFLKSFPNHKLFGKAQNKLNILNENSSNIKIKIGCILPLSGEAAASGQKILQGVQLAFSSIPEYQRKEIELIIKDSMGSSEKVASIMQDFGNDNDLVCVIGPMFSKTAETAIEKAEVYEVPIISPSASAEGLGEGSRFFFRNALTREMQGRAIAEYGVNNLELNRFITFYSSDAYGISLQNIFLDQVNLLGGEVLAGKSYSLEQNDFKEQILSFGGMNDRELNKKALKSVLEANTTFLMNDRNIVELNEVDKDEEMATILVEIIKKAKEKRGVPLETPKENENQEEMLTNNSRSEEDMLMEGTSNKTDLNDEILIDASAIEEEDIFLKPFLKINYDGIFIPGFPEKIGLIAPQLVFYNIENVQLLGGNGWNSDDIVELGGKYIRGAVFVDGFFSDSNLKQVKGFNELYNDFFGENPDILSAQAFDAANMVLDIISKGHQDRQGIRNELSKISKYKGVSGETTILPNGDSEKSLFFISVKNKKRIQVN